MSPSQSAAIIYDALLTGVVRTEIWGEARPELIRLIEGCLDEFKTEPDLDAYDTMLTDVMGVLLVHLKHIGDAKISRAVPVGPQVMKVWEEKK